MIISNRTVNLISSSYLVVYFVASQESSQRGGGRAVPAKRRSEKSSDGKHLNLISIIRKNLVIYCCYMFFQIRRSGKRSKDQMPGVKTLIQVNMNCKQSQ